MPLRTPSSKGYEHCGCNGEFKDVDVLQEEKNEGEKVHVGGGDVVGG